MTGCGVVAEWLRSISHHLLLLLLLLLLLREGEAGDLCTCMSNHCIPTQESMPHPVMSALAQAALAETLRAWGYNMEEDCPEQTMQNYKNNRRVGN